MVAVLAGLWFAGAAPAAVTWPATASWTPLYQSSANMVDSSADASPNQRDTVGSSTYDLAFWAYDDGGTPTGNTTDDYFLLRMRVDYTTPANMPASSSVWGMLIDINGSTGSAEWAFQLDQVTDNVVELSPATTTGPQFKNVVLNTTSTWSGSLASYRQFVTADDGSNFSGNADTFVDFAIPWDSFTTAVGSSDPTISLSPFTSAVHTGVSAAGYDVVPTGLARNDNISGGFSDPFKPKPVIPEPSTLALTGLMFAALVGTHTRRGRKGRKRKPAKVVAPSAL